MSSGKTDSPVVVQGIKINATHEDSQNFAITELVAATFDESLSESELGIARTRALVEVPKLLFGNDWERIKGELREKHGGVLDNAIVDEFTQQVFEALNRKN